MIDSGKFPWNNGKFPDFTTPSELMDGLVLWDKFGPMSFAIRFRLDQMRDMGPCLSPFASFLLLQGKKKKSFFSINVYSKGGKL